MALTAANPGGWSLNEVLTSAQMTHLQNELLKAIDGVNGGTYTLAAPLIFAGADVRMTTNLVIPSGGDIELENNADMNLASGADINLSSGAAIEVSLGALLQVGGELQVISGGLVTLENGADMFVDGTAVIGLEGSLAVNSGGSIDVTSGGDINVTSADVTINGGAQILLNGGSLIIGATGFVQANGGDITLGGGSRLIAGPGEGIDVEDANDITINDSPEGFRTTLIPFGFIATGWETRIVSELVWEQVDSSSDWRIVFPIVVPPGDDLVDVFVGVNGENGHGALPATMPRARLVRADLDGTFTVLATKTDPSPDVATYETPHYIILQNGSLDSGTMPQLADADPLYVIVQGETGANAIPGLEIGSITGNRIARSFRSDQAVYT